MAVQSQCAPSEWRLECFLSATMPYNEIYICLHGVLRLRCEWALVSGFMVHQV